MRGPPVWMCESTLSLLMFALSPSDPHHLTTSLPPLVSARGACMFLWMSVLFPLRVLNEPRWMKWGHVSGDGLTVWFTVSVCLSVVALRVLLRSWKLKWNCWTHVGYPENVSFVNRQCCSAGEALLSSLCLLWWSAGGPPEEVATDNLC